MKTFNAYYHAAADQSIGEAVIEDAMSHDERHFELMQEEADVALLRGAGRFNRIAKAYVPSH